METKYYMLVGKCLSDDGIVRIEPCYRLDGNDRVYYFRVENRATREVAFHKATQSQIRQILERFYEQNSSYLSQQELLCLCFAKTSTEAAKHPPLKIDGDAPITIHIGGNVEHWGSRWLCYHYYKQGAMECEGSSEGDRYNQILTGLLEGAQIPSDDVPLRCKSA